MAATWALATGILLLAEILTGRMLALTAAIGTAAAALAAASGMPLAAQLAVGLPAGAAGLAARPWIAQSEAAQHQGEPVRQAPQGIGLGGGSGQVPASRLTVAVVAAQLGTSDGAVRAMLGDGRLIGEQGSDGQWLIPDWQLPGGQMAHWLPGILAHLPDGAALADVERFLLRASEALPLDGRPASPLDWLSGHGDLEQVVALLGARDQDP